MIVFIPVTNISTYLFTDFSVASWLENNGLGHLSPIDSLWGDAIKFVTEVIGLDKYFLEEQCDVSKDPYKNATMSWNNGITNPLPASLR
jgi:hypothetical protein